MSRKRYKHCECERCRKNKRYEENYNYYPIGYSNPHGISFRYLVILILIILQFGKPKVCCDKGEERCRRPQLVDNSILFIIAMYFLSCCIPDR